MIDPMDSYFNKALEHAKALQQLALDAAQKGIEQSRPLVEQGMARATELQKTLLEQAPQLTGAAKEQADAALQHASAFIATGKTVLEAGTAQAQQHLTIFAEQAKKAADATVSAVQSATKKTPPSGGSTPPPQ
jgi:GTP cyclohydrolase FolE2